MPATLRSAVEKIGWAFLLASRPMIQIEPGRGLYDKYEKLDSLLDGDRHGGAPPWQF
jgi:hypothetical protein